MMSTRVPERAAVQTGHEETGYPRVVQHLHHERRDNLKTQKATKPYLLRLLNLSDIDLNVLIAARIEQLYNYVFILVSTINEY